MIINNSVLYVKYFNIIILDCQYSFSCLQDLAVVAHSEGDISEPKASGL